MKFKYLYKAAILASILLSCNNDDHQNIHSDKVTFVSGVDKLRTSQDGTKWSVGDQIGVYMSENGKTNFLKSNIPYKATTASQSSAFKALEENLIFPTDNTPVSFTAYYPYSDAVTEMKFPISIANQSESLIAHDLMYAKSDNNGKGFITGVVSFQFKHQLSKLILNLVDEKGNVLVADNDGIFIKGMNTQATFDLLTGTLGEATNHANIIPYKNDKSYEAIILPSTVGNGYELELRISGNRYIWAINNSFANLELKPGHAYTFKITVKTSSAEIEAELVDINGNSINPWGNGGDDNKPADKVDPIPDLAIPSDYEQISVANGSLIQKAITEATASKVALVLADGGNYSEGSFVIPASIKSLILVGKSGMNTPSVYIGGSLKAEGNMDLIHIYNVNLNGVLASSYFINQNVEVTIGKMLLDYCSVHDMRGVVRLQTSPSKINDLEINNSIIYNIGNYNILAVDAGAVCSVTLNRSTCYNLSGRGFNLSKMTEATTVTIKDCTFNQGPLYAIAQFSKDTGATMIFNNNIVGMPYNATRGISVTSNATTLTESNNFYVTNTVWQGSAVGTDCNLTDAALWPNVEEANFKQTALKAGDPRWY